MNAYEQQARARKADTLAAALTAAGQGDPQTAAKLDEAGWTALAALAGQKPPSEATRALVVRQLTERQRLVQADPFVGTS